MIEMNIIRTIDLWTEPSSNNIECFSGAFVDGFENDSIPFEKYKIVENCNCIITTNRADLNIKNKHNAIIFYQHAEPIRLMVLNKETNINVCIKEALSQSFNGSKLQDVYDRFLITGTVIDLDEPAIDNGIEQEIDVGSCDRPSLLKCMLEGSYTQSDTNYGKDNEDNNYNFTSEVFIEYKLITDKECFKITHHCAFLNESKTRIIPLQDNSKLDITMISKVFSPLVKKSEYQKLLVKK